MLDKLEIGIVKYFNRIGGGRFDVPMRFLSSIRFLAVFWVALVGIAVLSHPEITKQFCTTVLIVSGLHFGITEGVIKHLGKKFFTLRKRPYIAYPKKIQPIGHKFSDSSFPSSHMASTVAMLVVIVAFYPSLLLIAVLFSAMMAFARLHNGMHYPSDIVAGILLGLAYGWLALYLVK